MSITLTAAKLARFAEIRTLAGPRTNLQFATDTAAAGIDPKELGEPRHIRGSDGWYWTTPLGTLVEEDGFTRFDAGAQS